MSVTGAAAVATSVTGAITACSPRSSRHTVRIDIESLPTGMARPSATANSAPAARTASYSRASSPGQPAAAIQLHDSLTSPSAAIGAAARLVSASAIASRDAAGGIEQRHRRSLAHRHRLAGGPTKSVAVTATSPTGTCQRPTIGSVTTRPPTERSPIVTRNVLSATVGSRSTRSRAARR
jgi:hypothetical protein